MEREVLPLQSGEVEYIDTGGPGPPIVLLHGALMDEHLWRPVVDRLAPRYRCVVPVLPMGGHRIPRPDGADQSPIALARLVGEVIEALGLRGLTLVGNDTGGAIAQLLLAERPARVSRAVFVSCDAFENFPPGLPGRVMRLMCSVPGAMPMAIASLRVPPLRRLPVTFGWMAKRPIEDSVIGGWIDALAADKRIRRDVRALMKAVDRVQLVSAADDFARFDGGVLIVWAAEDRVMPLEHAHRLRRVFGDARVEFVHDSYTLVPLDQPDRLARLIEDFVPMSDSGERNSDMSDSAAQPAPEQYN